MSNGRAALYGAANDNEGGGNLDVAISICNLKPAR